MKKQEISAQAVVDVEMTAVDALSVDLAAVVAPQNELNQAFENDKKIDEELALSQAKGEALQVASADNGVAAALLTDTSAQAAGGAVVGGGVATVAGISANALLIAGTAAVAVVAVIANDDDKATAPVATTPVDPDPVDPEPVDSVPVVSANQSLSLVQGKSAVITVTATDADGDQLTYTPSNPATGSLSTNTPGQYTYTADASFVGTDAFTVTVSDEDNNNITRTITIEVTKATVIVSELTTGEDQILGGAEDNVINARFLDNVSTLTASDKIDGGEGEDTLNIYSDNASGINSVVPAGVEITDVEIINIFNVSAPAVGTNLFDASNYSGVTALNQIGVDVGEVTNLLATTTAGFTGTNAMSVSAEAATTSATVKLTDIDTDTAAASLAVLGDALSSLTVTGTTAGVAALNLNVTVGKDVEFLTVGTAVDIDLVVNDSGVVGSTKTVTTVDASGSTGDVTYDSTKNTSVATVTSGTGNDVVTLGTATDATPATLVNASLETGAGDDTVVLATSGDGDTTVNLGDGENELTAASYKATGLLTITGGSGVDTIKTFGATNLTINSGAGDDVITALSLNNDLNIDAGDGTDTVGLTAITFDATAYSQINGLTSVEQLFFETADTTVDGSLLKADFTQLTFTGAVGANNTATNITATQKIVASQIDVTAIAAIPLRVLNIEAIADGAQASEIVATADEVNLTVSTASATNNATALTGDFATANITLASTVNAGVDKIASITIDTAAGATALTELVITGEGNATVINDGNTLTSVNTSGLSNTLIDGKIASGLNYTAGDSVETITLRLGEDGGAKDELTFGAAASTYGDMDTVIGFDAVQEDPATDSTSTTDSIVFGGGAGNAVTLNGIGVDQAALVTLGTDTDSLFKAFEDAAEENDGEEVSFFHFGGDTYLFQNATLTDLLTPLLGELNDNDRALKVTGIVDFADNFAVNP